MLFLLFWFLFADSESFRVVLLWIALCLLVAIVLGLWLMGFRFGRLLVVVGGPAEFGWDG